MDKEEKILIEYQKAQDSAEHYNTIVWTLMSVGIGLSLIILYKVHSQEQNPLLEMIMLFVGMFVLFYFSYLIESATERKMWKYYVCQRIEWENGFIGQNRKIIYLPISKTKLFGGSFSMNLFRIIKILMYFFYLVSAILGIAELWKLGAITPLLIFSFILIAGAFVLFVVTEVWYFTIKHNLESLWDRKE